MKRYGRSAILLSLVCAASLTASCASDGTMPGLEKAGSLLKGAGTGSGNALSSDQIVAGLKEALSKGSETVVGRLGQSGGFSKDPGVRIPLPASLAKARDFAGKFGMNSSFDDLENRLNLAAEAATPKAKNLFLGAIADMSVQDAKGILSGPDNAATQYFESRTRPTLGGDMRPIVDQSLSEVGAVKSLQQLLGRYQQIPLAPKIDTDLTGYVVDKGMDGIFKYLASEEKAIRENPAKRTTELLQKVFAAR